MDFPFSRLIMLHTLVLMCASWHAACIVSPLPTRPHMRQRGSKEGRRETVKLSLSFFLSRSFLRPIHGEASLGRAVRQAVGGETLGIKGSSVPSPPSLPRQIACSPKAESWTKGHRQRDPLIMIPSSSSVVCLVVVVVIALCGQSAKGTCRWKLGQMKHIVRVSVLVLYYIRFRTVSRRANSMDRTWVTATAFYVILLVIAEY